MQHRARHMKTSVGSVVAGDKRFDNNTAEQRSIFVHISVHDTDRGKPKY